MTDEEEFGVIMRFMYLVRSGQYKRVKDLMPELRREYPHLTEEEIISVCQPAIKSLCGAGE